MTSPNFLGRKNGGRGVEDRVGYAWRFRIFLCEVLCRLQGIEKKEDISWLIYPLLLPGEPFQATRWADLFSGHQYISGGGDAI